MSAADFLALIPPHARALLEDPAAAAANDADVAKWESEVERRIASQARDAERTLRRNRLHDSGLLLDATDYGLLVEDRLENTKALTYTKRWLVSTVRALVLLGDRAAGKNIAAGYALARLGGSAIECAEVTRLAESRWAADVDRWERLCRARLLVVDEMEPRHDVALFTLLQHRQGCDRRGEPRRTIFLGNVSPEEFAGCFDSRAWSRLLRLMGGDHAKPPIVSLFGEPDMRQRRRK
jgi:hypothetical protein